jgi:hypothetical protein|tara:strand:+ start:243 stop:1103 length:861 start_codon:yes stop_codon:yes gene_type:complete
MAYSVSKIAFMSFFLGSSGFAQTLEELWVVDGFNLPESAFYDAATNRIYVSEIGVFGPGGGMDGAISILSVDGELVQSGWVTGLMDPKGMASMDGSLWVADAMGVHEIGLASGHRKATIPLDGAMFPNDVAASRDGAILVTDMFGGAIYRVADGIAEAWLPMGSLSLPNGIWVDDSGIVVGTFGVDMQLDFSVAEAGTLYSISDAGEIAVIEGSEKVGSIDGVVRVGDLLVFDDNPTGRILAWQDGMVSLLMQSEPGTADLGVMDNTILVPNLNNGSVTAYTFSDN